MGLPTGGSYDINTFASWYSYYAAGFVQDDWRVRRNLTVNLGLRFDHDARTREVWTHGERLRYNYANPLAAAAHAAYAKTPIAQLPASAFNVLGGLTFPGSGQTAVYQNNSHLVSPRVGFAWTPKILHGKTVHPRRLRHVRGAGHHRVHGRQRQVLHQPEYQPGRLQPVHVAHRHQQQLSDAAGHAEQPFPHRLPAGHGLLAGLPTFAGQDITFLNPDDEEPLLAALEHRFSTKSDQDMMLEVDYIGNHAVHLPINYTQLNGIPRQYLSTLAMRDPNQTYLANSVANPFSGLQSSQNTATTTSAQLLARYPEFPVGDSASGWSGGAE